MHIFQFKEAIKKITYFLNQTMSMKIPDVVLGKSSTDVQN